jgi:hypothetical protein
LSWRNADDASANPGCGEKNLDVKRFSDDSIQLDGLFLHALRVPAKATL